MAANSKREQILVYHEQTIIGAISSISAVARKMPTYEGLGEIALTQFPYCAVVGKLPVPAEKKSGRRNQPGVDIIISSMDIDNFIYLQENETPDTVLSNIADDVFRSCYADPTYGGLIMGVLVKPDPNPAYFAPYVMFRMTSQVTYQHDTGGI